MYPPDAFTLEPVKLSCNSVQVRTIPKAKRVSMSSHKRCQQGFKLKDTKSTMTPVATAAKVSTVKPKEVKEKQHSYRHSNKEEEEK